MVRKNQRGKEVVLNITSIWAGEVEDSRHNRIFLFFFAFNCYDFSDVVFVDKAMV